LIKKGIILAGGTGSRLFPSTLSVNKQLLMLYDKPVIYYPLSILMLSGIKDILIIVNKGQIDNFKKILKNGQQFGIRIEYAEQYMPKGIPEAFIIGEKFIAKENIALILGDNFFYGQSLGDILKKACKNFKSGANIFLKNVKNPENFGVAKVKNSKIINIIEKPKKFLSSHAITGLYFFDNNVVRYAKGLNKSERDELEITSVIKKYKKNNKLKYTKLGLGSIWSDTGTVKDMQEVSNYIQSIDKIQNFKIACLEEIGLRNKWLKKKEIIKNISKFKNSEYFNYVYNLIKLRII